MVGYLKSEEEYHCALKDAGEKLVVIDFTATWCGPCQIIAPDFDKLSTDNPDIVLHKVDVDDASDVAQLCEIRSMPTFIFYKSGKEVERFSGADIAKLKNTIKKLC
ncbi:thioredoxin-2 [Xenopus laevis]|uniref:Thioredoxin-2 n=1 Tax=Xenopus laevis TaxID=8355 RepID=A0A8J0UA65_XENLA|nr:thioredoxin-2 [Xenopus laevis]